ncbi:hypothetical protein BZM27_54505, partial [Paraburkholderia steynii]
VRILAAEARSSDVQVLRKLPAHLAINLVPFAHDHVKLFSDLKASCCRGIEVVEFACGIIESAQDRFHR